MQEGTTDTVDVPAPTQPRLTFEGERFGFHWRVWMHSPLSFSFDIREGVDADALYEAEMRWINAGKAERAACDWIDAEIKRREEVVATALPTSPTSIAGWELTPKNDKDGLYKIDLVNTTTGEIGPESYCGYMRWQAALADASAWARENPCDGSEPVVAPAHDAKGLVIDAEVPDTKAVEVAEVPTQRDDAELVRLRQQLATRDLELEATKKQLAGVAVDISEAGAQADEATALILEIREDEAQIKVLKDELKAKKSRFDLLTGKLASHIQAVIRGKAPPAFQLTFANDKGTRDRVGADAERVAEQLTRPEGWAYNGKEYTIDVEPVATGGYSAWLRGHRAATEAPHETLAGAIAEAKNRASLLLKDAEPGEGLPTEAPATAGSDAALAPSQAMPEVKLPPPKAGKLKGRDRDAVVAALRKSKALVDALEELTVTKLQLEKYAKKAEIDIGRTLNTAEEPELPPTPEQAVPARGRGGKRGGGRKGRGR